MTKALADSNAKARKVAEKKAADKGVTPYKHEPAPGPHVDSSKEAEKYLGWGQKPSPAKAVPEHSEQSLDSDQAPVIESELGAAPIAGIVTQLTKESTMTTEAPTKTKQELDAEKAQAKIAAKAEKTRLAEEAKAKREAEKVAKAAQRAAEKAERDAAKAASRDAAAAARQGEPRERTYHGSMLSLADRVKAGAYVKGLNGQLRSNDDVAIALESVPAEKIVQLVMEVFGTTDNKYAGLNPGQQSMNWRNRLRGAVRKGVEIEINGQKVKISIERVKELRDAGGYAIAEKQVAEKQPAEAAA